MELAKILKNLRIENRITQKELSERLKIEQATIACYENGQREPHISSLIAYADFFECSIDYLIGRSDDFGNVVVGAERSRLSRSTLSDDEQSLLKKYRGMSSNEKAKLVGYIDGLTEK